MDLVRYFHFSFSGLKGLFSRRTFILVLMAVLLYQTAGVFYKALTLQLLRMTPPPAAEILTPIAVTVVREPLDAYRTILERNIFDTTTKTIEEKSAQNKPQHQPDIAILFDLRGTVAGDAKYGFAVIEEKGTRKQRLVKIGDVISGARVVRINRSSLDVLIDDKERTLKMAERTEAPIVPPAAVKGAVAPVAGDSTVTVNRSEISNALADMGTLLRQALMRPYFKDGVPDGFIVTNIVPGSLYERMGIANGDILKEVDGRKISTADDMMAFLTTLKGASGMALSFQRRGKPQTLKYQFR